MAEAEFEKMVIIRIAGVLFGGKGGQLLCCVLAVRIEY
jgi:hypothetical protein